MVVWRISNYADLSGIGGMLASARWHSIGRPIVYTAEHPALALLETLVHLERGDLPSHYQLLTVEFPDDAIGDPRETSSDTSNAMRRLGDAWLANASSLALRVPSVAAPHSWNYLINPAHPQIGRAHIVRVERWPFDERLI